MSLKKYPVAVVELATGLPRRLIYSRCTDVGISAAGGITVPEVIRVLGVKPRPRDPEPANPDDVAELRYILEACGALGRHPSPDQISIFDDHDI